MRRTIVVFLAEFSVQIYPALILKFDTVDGMFGKQLIFFFHKTYAVFFVSHQQHVAGIAEIF